MKKSSPGNQELEVLRFVAAHRPMSVREVADTYGAPRGLARTTILTMMERLRQKGYLTRTKQGDVYRYTCTVEPSGVMRKLVSDFVEKTLGGSVTPFVAYLAEEKNLTDEEISALRRLLAEMEAGGEEPSR